MRSQRRKSSETSRRDAEPTMDKSLTGIASRFLELIEVSPGGSVNLNTAAETLGVKKRRLYDVTNVLEGVDLLSKSWSNTVQWKVKETETAKGNATEEVISKELNQRVAELEEAHANLEQEIDKVHDALKRIWMDPEVQRQCFVRVSDLMQIEALGDRNVFLIKGPDDAEVCISRAEQKNDDK